MVKVAQVLKPRGIRGEIYILFTNPDFTTLRPDSKLNISGKTYEVADFWQYSNKNVLSLKGIETRNDVEPLRNRDIILEGVDPAPLHEGEFYIKNCIDSKVDLPSGETIGTIVDIERGSFYDYFVVALIRGGKISIPMISPICKTVMFEKKRLIVNLPDNYIQIFSEGNNNELRGINGMKSSNGKEDVNEG